MYRYCIFCYNEEAPLLQYTIQQLHNLNKDHEYSIDLFVDHTMPFSYNDEQTLYSILNGKGSIHITYYPRNGNQHGHDCIIGMLKAMKSVVKCPDDEIVVKVDPDTLVFDLKWLHTFASATTKYFTASYRIHPHYAMGLTYAIKPCIIDDIIKDEEDFPSHHDALENFEISQRVFRIYGEPGVIRIPFGPEAYKGMYIGEPHKLPTENGMVEQQLMRLTSYSCGWSYRATPVQDKMKYRQAQLEFLKYVVENFNKPEATPTTVVTKTDNPTKEPVTISTTSVVKKDNCGTLKK